MSSATDRSSDIALPPPLRIAMQTCPMMTVLDCAGPQAVLAMHGETYFVSNDREPVLCDTGVAVRPTHTLQTCAGALEGYLAATHWAAHDAPDQMDVYASRERVVIDRNRMTGGGVTAGIDFGLTLLSRLRGDMAAKALQLSFECDFAPPFVGGTPETAEPEVLAAFRSMISAMNAKTIESVRRVRGRRLA